MKKARIQENILNITVIILLTLLNTFNLIIRKGHPITFDGHIHMTTMNQFAQSLKNNEFPVTWSNNFANYGLPIPIFAHQLPAYLGASLIILGFSTETAFMTLIVISVFLTALTSLIFFKKFADNNLALVAVTLSIFFPYKALNIYTRGALPELMSIIFLPLLFLGFYFIQKQKYQKAGILITSNIFAIAITHPMMLLVFSIPVSLYFFTHLTKKHLKKELLIILVSISLGLLLASYYLIPLILEMKYFYQGAIKDIISNDRFLQFKQLFNPNWYYTLMHPGPRANYIKLGLIEFLILVTSILTVSLTQLFTHLKQKYKQQLNKKYLKELAIWTSISLICVLFILPITTLIYQLPLFSKIQYPWRFLNTLQFLIPMTFILLIKVIKKINNKVFLLSLFFLILWLRVPQFYGKNYVAQPEKDYYFNQANLYSLNMNTIWSDNSENYPIKTKQAEIVEGNGELKTIKLQSASREYIINADEKVKVVDYTFYFPGWQVLNKDREKINIEYQDPLYRGLITYVLPAGKHHLYLQYKPTKVRMLANFLSIIGLITSLSILVYFKKTH